MALPHNTAVALRPRHPVRLARDHDVVAGVVEGVAHEHALVDPWEGRVDCRVLAPHPLVVVPRPAHTHAPRQHHVSTTSAPVFRDLHPRTTSAPRQHQCSATCTHAPCEPRRRVAFMHDKTRYDTVAPSPQPCTCVGFADSNTKAWPLFSVSDVCVRALPHACTCTHALPLRCRVCMRRGRLTPGQTRQARPKTAREGGVWADLPAHDDAVVHVRDVVRLPPAPHRAPRRRADLRRGAERRAVGWLVPGGAQALTQAQET